jgi:hypothetical protein
MITKLYNLLLYWAEVESPWPYAILLAGTLLALVFGVHPTAHAHLVRVCRTITR